MHQSAERMWREFVGSGSPAAAGAAQAPFSAWHFGVGGSMADELAALVVAGHKRATAGSLWSYEQEGDPLPMPGDFSVILDGAGVARCIIRTTQVDIVPFNEVSEEFAATEGEGDGSLRYWLEGHWRYFSAELAEFGREARQDMPVVCERFEVVWGLGGALDG